jgi:hypothetical protein
MACNCDSCSSPRIIKTRTATFWRWLAESRGETANRVILAPARAAVAVLDRPADQDMPRETVATSSDGPADVAELDQRRAEFLKIVSGGDRV